MTIKSIYEGIRGECKECTKEKTSCPSGEFCNLTSNMCEVKCSYSSQCIYPETSRCNKFVLLLNIGGEINECVMC